MNIYAIAIYPNNANPIIATSHTNVLKADPFKELIEDTIKPLADEIRKQKQMPQFMERTLKDVYKIKIAEGIFYGQFTDNYTMLLITDDVMPASNLKQLIDNIIAAKDSKSSLRNIVRNPENAAKTKINLIQEDLEDIKDIMVDNVLKMQLRGDKLEALKDKSEELLQNAQSFRQGAKKLREQACWDAFWPYRFYKWMWPPKDDKNSKQPEVAPTNKLRY